MKYTPEQIKTLKEFAGIENDVRIITIQGEEWISCDFSKIWPELGRQEFKDEDEFFEFIIKINN